MSKQKALIPAGRADIRATEGITREDYTYKVDFKLINPDTVFNERIDYGDDLEEFAKNIHENGLLQPLLGIFVKKPNGSLLFDLTDGFRRYAAYKLLRKQGKDIGEILCRIKVMSLEDRLLTMFSTQHFSKPLTSIEVSNVFRKLINLGFTEEKIKEKIGLHKSITYVKDMLILSQLPESVKEAITSKRTTATAAIAAAKSVGVDKTQELVSESTKNNKKFEVKDAKAVADEHKGQGKLVYQHEKVFQIPETIDGMEAVKAEILALTTRSTKQLRVLRELDTKLDLAKSRKEYQQTTRETVLDRDSVFNTRLKTKFAATFCDQLETGLCEQIWEFFKLEVESAE